MLRAYVAQQRQLLHMAQKITLPQTDCRQVSPRCPFSSGSSVPSGSSVSPCSPLACNSRSSFSTNCVWVAAAVGCDWQSERRQRYSGRRDRQPGGECRRHGQFCSRREDNTKRVGRRDRQPGSECRRDGQLCSRLRLAPSRRQQ